MDKIGGEGDDLRMVGRGLQSRSVGQTLDGGKPGSEATTAVGKRKKKQEAGLGIQTEENPNARRRSKEIDETLE